ncbi:MAG: cytochrome c maturation protein CcmE [Bacteriovoracaceae bacterium]|nr:cytochrome c maturation protein CcmE [Bacteroidota bacterium]
MNLKVIVASIIIVGALIFGASTFMESNIEYMDFEMAQTVNKKVQVKGRWVKEKESNFDATTSQFTFYMVDDNNQEVKVVLDGAKPNNFEIATEVVAKGRFKDGYFHANELLTKCPSKYEGDGEAVKKTL